MVGRGTIGWYINTTNDLLAVTIGSDGIVFAGDELIVGEAQDGKR